MKLLKLCSLNPGLPGGLLAPDLKMFKRDVLPTLREICDANNIPMRFHGTEYELHFPTTDSRIYVFHGEDKGQSIRGPNLAFGLINEVTLIDYESFTAFVGRIRLKKANLRQLAMSGTPEGFTWHYEYFIENPREDTDLIFGNTKDNIYVSDDYVKMLYDSYDGLMAQQFVEGAYINLTGRRACYAFSRQKHVNPEIVYNPDLPVWVSLDFNLYPMAATLWHRVPNLQTHMRGSASPIWLRAFDEIALNSSDTDEMAQAIKDKLGEAWRQCAIFPDPAGDAGSTKSKGKSDIDILKQHGFTDIRYKRSITSVRDCLNAANNLFEKGRIEVSPKCKNFIADLEQCILKQGTSLIDKSDPKRSHWLDGFKDMVDYEFPIRRPQNRITEQRIR